MRFEKRIYEDVTVDLTGKDVQIHNDAEIILSLEEAKNLLTCISALYVRDETVQNFYETIQAASEFVKKNL